MREKLIDIYRNEKLRSFIDENRDMLIKVAAAAVLVTAAFFVFVAGGEEEDKRAAVEKPVVTEEETTAAVILVDIGGEVNNPMVAQLKEGSRVDDAIMAAGGVTENADLTQINRAAFVEDGEKILIPSREGEGLYGEPGDEMTVTGYHDERININTAGSEELQLLDGIGPVTAQKIIEYREENGRFRSIEDIKEVSGIGDKTFEKFKDDIRT